MGYFQGAASNSKQMLSTSFRPVLRQIHSSNHMGHSRAKRQATLRNMWEHRLSVSTKAQPSVSYNIRKVVFSLVTVMVLSSYSGNDTMIHICTERCWYSLNTETAQRHNLAWLYDHQAWMPTIFTQTSEIAFLWPQLLIKKKNSMEEGKAKTPMVWKKASKE